MNSALVLKRRAKLRQAVIGAAALLSISALSRGSSTWIADSDGTWTDPANWFNNVVPSGSDGAFLGFASTQTGPHTITLNTAATPNIIEFASPFPYTISGSGTFASVGSIFTYNSTFASRPLDSLNQFQFGDVIAVPFVGATPAKTGTGALTLKGISACQGTFNINGGVVYATDNNDAAFGDSSNSISLADGTALGNYATSGNTTYVTSRQINLNSGTIELRNLAPMTINNTIGGSGALVHRSTGAGTGTLTIGGNAIYSGATTIRDNDVIKISGANGLILNSPRFNLNGTLILDNAASASSNRLNSGTIDSNGGGVMLIGHRAISINEGIGNIVLDGGMSQVGLVNNGANAILSAPAMLRGGRSTGFVHGDALGTGVAATNTNLLLTNVPTLVGGGGSAGSTNLSIVPWLIGNGSGTTTLNIANNSFLTYGAFGLRPLDLNTEYTAGLTSGQNVRVSAAQANGSAVSVNALMVAGTILSGAGTITVSSGAVALIGSGSTGPTISAPLAFGSAEGIIHTTAAAGTISGVISGTNGLTKSGFGSLTLGTANVYTGTTTINSGALLVPGNVSSAGFNGDPLGSDFASIAITGGSGASPGVAKLLSTQKGSDTNLTYTFAHNINVNNTTADSVGVIGVSAASIAAHDNINFIGQININGGLLRIEGDPGATITLSGTISGTGGITDAPGSRIVVSGSNFFTGASTLTSGNLYVSGSQPMGTSGTLTLSNTSSPTAANPNPGMIAPANQSSFATLFNPIIVSSLGPADGNYPGVILGGASPLDLGGQINLNGAQRTFTITNTTVVELGAMSNGGFDKRGPGRVEFDSLNTYTGHTIVESGTLSFFQNQYYSDLSLFSGTTAEIFSGRNLLLKIRSLSVAGTLSAPTGTLNLNDNDLSVGSLTTFAAVQSLVKTARDGGQWDKPGITTALAKPSGTALKPTGLGVLTGTEYISVNASNTVFDGQPVAASDALVKYTWNGDANFDGKIDANDYARIDAGFQLQSQGGFVFDWFHGDFDYNGSIDANDYALIDAAFQLQTGTLRPALAWLQGDGGSLTAEELNSAGVRMVIDHYNEFGGAYLGAFLQNNVPEPASVSVWAAGLVLLARRRRRAVLTWCGEQFV